MIFMNYNVVREGWNEFVVIWRAACLGKKWSEISKEWKYSPTEEWIWAGSTYQDKWKTKRAIKRNQVLNRGGISELKDGSWDWKGEK